MTLCVAPRNIQSAITLTSTSTLVQPRRFQFSSAATANRDQEAFLSQFDPTDVLGIDPDCTIDEIDAAFEKKKAFYAVNGPMPDAKMVNRVFQAHEILKDPNSPYYLKAHTSQTERQRLQFQLLPKNKRRLVELQVAIVMSVLFLGFVLVVKMCFKPMNHSLRAATR